MLPSKLSDPFISLLCGATLQFYSYTPSVKLACNPQQPTHSAGLPFFATDWMRCWGRDTFVSFKGNFLVTKRWSAAKGLLLCFGQVVRYGLIPNLLGSQKTPRYNARDVTWFYIQAIKDFCSLSPEGNNFLTTEIQFQTPLEQHSPWILKCFPHVNPPFNSLTFAQLIHYIMSSHVFGIQITESNVGGTLDKLMKPEGLHITAYVDKNTGFVYGGNKYNCGTWMDKMGSSKIVR
jgi:glycogen debranching enzyme